MESCFDNIVQIMFSPVSVKEEVHEPENHGCEEVHEAENHECEEVNEPEDYKCKEGNEPEDYQCKEVNEAEDHEYKEKHENPNLKYKKEHEHENRKGSIVCVRCQKSLFKKRTYALTEGPINNFIAEEIAPREIPEGGLVCISCWQYTQRTLQKRGIASSFEGEASLNVCVCCFRSLSKKRRHVIPEEGPERDAILSKINPREIPPGGLVCYACWVAARRNVQKDNTKEDSKQGPAFVRHEDSSCEWCKNLLYRKVYRVLPNGTMRALVAAKIYPRELSDHALLCLNCWKTAQGLLQEDENGLQNQQPSIEIDGFAHTTHSSSSCFVPGCKNPERFRVPQFIRKDIYKNLKLFVTENSRICNEHKSSPDWNFIDQRLFSHTFTKTELESMLKFAHQYI